MLVNHDFEELQYLVVSSKSQVNLPLSRVPTELID